MLIINIKKYIMMNLATHQIHHWENEPYRTITYSFYIISGQFNPGYHSKYSMIRYS